MSIKYIIFVAGAGAGVGVGASTRTGAGASTRTGAGASTRTGAGDLIPGYVDMGPIIDIYNFIIY